MYSIMICSKIILTSIFYQSLLKGKHHTKSSSKLTDNTRTDKNKNKKSLRVDTKTEKKIIDNYMNKFIKENFNELQSICRNIINTDNYAIVTNIYGIFNHCMTDYFSIFMDIYTVGLINQHSILNKTNNDISIIIAGNKHIEIYRQYFMNNDYNVTHYSTSNNTEKYYLIMI